MKVILQFLLPGVIRESFVQHSTTTLEGNDPAGRAIHDRSRVTAPSHRGLAAQYTTSKSVRASPKHPDLNRFTYRGDRLSLTPVVPTV